MSILNTPAKKYFRFRMYCNLFFSNGSIYEKAIIEKITHVRRMVRRGIDKGDIDTYLKNIVVTELEAIRGDSWAVQAWSELNDGEAPHFHLLVEDVKITLEAFAKELELYFPEQVNAEALSQAATMKARAIQYAQKVKEGDFEGAKKELEALSSYFFEEITYINLNPIDKDSYRVEYQRNFTQWYQALGFKSESELDNLTAYEFLMKNETELKRQEALRGNK